MNYLSNDQRKKAKRLILLFFAASFLITLIWNIAIVTAPIAKANGSDYLANLIYSFFAHTCHQVDSRSFHLYGFQLAVCARCFGFYVGLLSGFLIYPFVKSLDEIKTINPLWLVGFLILSSLDWGLGVMGIMENTHLSRFVTAFLLGFVCVFYVVPTLSEMTYYFIYQNRI